MKFCKISIILSVLIFCLYLIAKINSFILLPFLPENFVYFVCLSIISIMNIIILIISTKENNKNIRMFVAIISALSAGFFFINVPFNSKREDKNLYIFNRNIQISRYKVLTDQRISIKYIYNNLCAKTLEYQIMPTCNESLNNCIEINSENDNYIEIQYLIKEQERFIWLYDCSENKIVQKENERLNISK